MNSKIENILAHAGEKMRVAVSHDKGNVTDNFIQTSQFKIYDIQDGLINISLIVNADCSGGYGVLVSRLKEMKADVLICGNIASGTRLAVTQAGIVLYANIAGEADATVSALLEGKLRYDAKYAAGC
jgi:predicted Fe-Mo cluster-binding NifX family protein